jgi:DNA-binding transcriptional ArsR family regulator
MESTSAIKSLAALAQETRLSIFRLLVEAGPDGMPVGALLESVGAAPATMSFHLKELANAGLVSARQDGRFIYYSAQFEQINDLLGFLTLNCCAKSGARCSPRRATGRRARATSRSTHA